MTVASPITRAVPHGALHHFARAKITPVSLDHIYSFGRQALARRHDPARILRVSAQFLHRELPVRVYQNLKVLRAQSWVPLVASSPVLQCLTERYTDDLNLLTSLEVPNDTRTEAKFLQTLRVLQARHQDHMALARRGIEQLRQNRPESISAHVEPRVSTTADSTTPGESAPAASIYTGNSEPKVENQLADRFMDDLYTASIGDQLLINEYVFLADHGRNLVRRIQPDQIAQQVIREVQAAARNFKLGPVADIELNAPATQASILHIEPYVANVLFKILYNSVFATMNHHHEQRSRSAATSTLSATPPPPVRLTIVGGSEDVAFKVSDEAGGLSLSKMGQLWRHTIDDCKGGDGGRARRTHAPHHLSFLGSPLNLPTARLIARYFGGDLSLVSMEGHGTDTYLHLPRRPTFTESLPPSLVERLDTPASSLTSSAVQWPLVDEILTR
ncbi:[Pyruvate dehydrogenase (acetyl-transferring)] kinase isozyme 2 [Tieghemiomyces parasiticus]|uniref:Protein-serine/threonine kinase n=1 Tax=Tieghemiomyces parasiticus TaxID=78921 RepID=A0A9W8A2I7_9FUNG|nr:[Pyruvate dehydrogenase (acetyl-transferring)] kinase isozyme 2 [Tieghemiomyces parasiticus]